MEVISSNLRLHWESHRNKNLCALIRLCEGTLLWPLRLNFFGSTFPHITAQFSFVRPSTFIFIVFWWALKQEGSRSAHQRNLIPNQPTPVTLLPTPPNLPLIPWQGKQHAAPRHSASPQASGGSLRPHTPDDETSQSRWKGRILPWHTQYQTVVFP